MPDVTKHDHGSFSWAELATSDAAAAKKSSTDALRLVRQGQSHGPGPAGRLHDRCRCPGRTSAPSTRCAPTRSRQGVPPHWTTYVTVKSADETAAKAKSLGGKVIVEPFDVMTFGRMAVIQDPAGAIFADLGGTRAHRRAARQRARRVLLDGAADAGPRQGQGVLRGSLRLGLQGLDEPRHAVHGDPPRRQADRRHDAADARDGEDAVPGASTGRSRDVDAFDLQGEVSRRQDARRAAATSRTSAGSRCSRTRRARRSRSSSRRATPDRGSPPPGQSLMKIRLR